MKALPCINYGKSAILNCFMRPLPNQTYRLISCACPDIKKAACKPRLVSKSLENSVRGCTSWSMNCGFRRPKSCKHGGYGRGLKTMCQGSGIPPPDSPTSEKEVEDKLRQSLLLRTSERLQDLMNKPEICTADELHYVAVPGTNWRLALWHYHPSPKAPKRNHPLLLLSGIGTNAVGFDLDPSVSMARYMAETGFDTWILEVRGAGLSKSEAELESQIGQESKEEAGDAAVIRSEDAVKTSGADVDFNGEPNDVQMGTKNGSAQQVTSSSEKDTVADHQDIIESSLKVAEGGASWEAWSTASRLSHTILNLSEKLSRLLSAGESKTFTARLVERISSLIESSLLSGRVAELRDSLASLIEARESGALIPSQVADLRNRLAKLLEDGQVAVSPTVSDLQERLSNTVDEFQKIVDLIARYDWDFDNYLNEDVPTALDYIRNHSKPVDGRVLTIGHSMGGIVLYAHLSSRGCDSGLAAAVSLASALDYGVSNTTLKLLLPLTDPAQLLNVPVVPLGALMAAVQPLVTNPPYPLAWLGYNVSAQNMMDTALFNKLVLNNFGTIPVKLLLHLATVFQPGGLQNRDGTVKYKENICKVDVPVLALAADKDLICPPIAVLDTAKEFPKDMITYKVFGGENDRHYGHYDLVCSKAAKEEVFPYVRDFLVKNDFVRVKEDKTNLEVSSRRG